MKTFKELSEKKTSIVMMSMWGIDWMKDNNSKSVYAATKAAQKEFKFSDDDAEKVYTRIRDNI